MLGFPYILIATALLSHTIRPLEMSGKNKIRGGQSQDVLKRTTGVRG
jgi:hypothetical protein